MYVIYPADDLICGLIASEYCPIQEHNQRLRLQQRQAIICPNLSPEQEEEDQGNNLLLTAFVPGSHRRRLPRSLSLEPSLLRVPTTTESESSGGNTRNQEEKQEISEDTDEPHPPLGLVPPPRTRRKGSIINTNLGENLGNHCTLAPSITRNPDNRPNKPKRSVSFTTTAFTLKSSKGSSKKEGSLPPGGGGGTGTTPTTPSRSSSSSTSSHYYPHQYQKVGPATTPGEPVPRAGFSLNLNLPFKFTKGTTPTSGGATPGLPFSFAPRTRVVGGSGGLTPKITFEEDDSSFQDYRGKSHHGGGTVTPSGLYLPPTTPQPGGSPLPGVSLSKKPPLPPLGNFSGGQNQNPHPQPTPSPQPASRGSSVPRSLLLSSNNGIGIHTDKKPSKPLLRRSLSRNSPKDPHNNNPGSGGAMLGLNGGISGSLMTLGQSGLSSTSGLGGGGSSAIVPSTVPIDANSLKDCAHPSLNESLKGHNSLSFQLIRIVSDFTQQLAQIHEQHSVQLQLLVENFRKRNSDLRKEKPPGSSALFHIWETLLQEVEIDSQAHSDISGSLGRQIARPLLEKTFCLKIQSRKVFAHRENFETVLAKAEAGLASAYRDYSEACLQHMEQGSSATLANYYDAHNAYVQQLRGTNAMLREYHNETLPALLQELDEVYVDLCNTLGESILLGSEIIASRAQESNRRYEGLAGVCRYVNGGQDLKEYVKGMVVPAPPPPTKHHFQVPLPILQASESADQDLSHVPIFKEEVIMERQAAVSARNRLEALKKDIATTENEIKQLQDAMDTLIRMQERSLDSNLWNKANELQEEISMKRFDLRVAQLHFSSLKSQKELYAPGSTTVSSSSKSTSLAGRMANSIGGSDPSSSDPSNNGGGNKGGGLSLSVGGKSLVGAQGGGGPSSASSSQGMKSKWLKAFKTLKSTTDKEPAAPVPVPVLEPRKQNQMFNAVTAIMMMRKNGKDKELLKEGNFQIFENHIFVEYTYKKITPCDICSAILRGHTRQGLRCRMCKLNVHFDCQEKVGKCQPKTRLLRRQRSTSELETRLSQLAEQQARQEQEEGEESASGSGGGGNEVDTTYQVLKEANVLKRPGSVHGSNQALYQHEMTPGRSGILGGGPRAGNPSVNVQHSGASSAAHSGPSTPVHPSVAAASVSGSRTLLFSTSTSPPSRLSQRRDSYLSRKSISADGEGTVSTTTAALTPINLPPRSVSLTASPMPHSPRRRKLDLRMKSFSLDSPESTEHAQRRRYHTTNPHGSHSTSHSQSSFGPVPLVPLPGGYPTNPPYSSYTSSANPGFNMAHLAILLSNNSSNSSLYNYPYNNNQFAPSSPVHNRRTLLSTRNMRMSSVELPDENDKSSASASPCPSPQKPHRLLPVPTNLYVCLYMFKARHPDELDLKAGSRVTVVDTSDPDWWQGKCMGRVGYFPSKYVTKLHPGEKPLQVTHNLQVTDGADNGLKLLRDQIVIQIGEELDGMVTIRNGDNKQGICPVKYLQEV